MPNATRVSLLQVSSETANELAKKGFETGSKGGEEIAKVIAKGAEETAKNALPLAEQGVKKLVEETPRLLEASKVRPWL